MFDATTCTAVTERWADMQRIAETHAGGFGHLDEKPGPDLAADLNYWEPESRAHGELIERIGSWEKLRAWVDAAQLAEIAELVHRRRAADELERADHAARGGQGEPAQLMEFVVDEIALAARTSRVAASHRLDLAQDLSGALPKVFAALSDGRIDLGRARIIAEATRSLEPELRVRVSDSVLANAGRQTPSTLRAALARAISIVDPDGVEERHTADLTRRRVTLTPADNGMTHLWAFLPASGAAAIMATLNRLAQGSQTPADAKSGDQRTADQRRADALVDLATSYLDAHPGLTPTPTSPTYAALPTCATATTGARAKTSAQAGRDAATTDSGPTGQSRQNPTVGGGRHQTRRPPAWAQVQVVLPANLLTGAGPEPAELLGYGPIPTSMAQAIAADATLQRLLTDPATGALTDVGTTRYTPPEALAAFGITRDRRCRFPGCRQPRTDLDHNEPYPTGPTADYNLAALCRHHHRLKQHPRWQATLHRDASMTWTTPTGHTHTTSPPLPVEPAPTDPPPF